MYSSTAGAGHRQEATLLHAGKSFRMIKSNTMGCVERPVGCFDLRIPAAWSAVQLLVRLLETSEAAH